MDLDKLKGLGDEKVMNEYLKEAEEVSFEGGVGEAYDKEWALRDQGYRDGLSQGKAEGRKEGKAEGISEGKNERNIEIAKNMLNEGIDINIIIKCTGLTNEDINALK